jgi:HK97 family phage major capsid protein
MGAMTQEQLRDYIKEQTLPMIKDTVGSIVAEVVRENVEQALKARGNGAVTRMFADKPDQPAPEQEKGQTMARCLRAVAAAKLNGYGPDKAIEYLKSWGDSKAADVWAEARAKALASNDPVAGGFLVPTQFSQEVIELLRPVAVVRSLNPMMLPMPTGGVKIPKITDGTTAGYIGENDAAPKTEPKFGQITLTFKKLAALVPISNDLIRYSSPAADSIVRDDMVRAMAQKEDYSFLRSAGTSATPKGLKYWMHANNKLAANGTVSLANVTTDLGRLIQALMSADVPLGIGAANQGGAGARPGWILTPRSYRYLTTVQNGLGAYAFRDEMMRGMLWGWPFRVTTQIPETMTSAGADTGGTQSEIYFGAFAHAVIGEALGMQVDASQEAAYHDGSTVVAAFSNDQTVVRVLAEHDFALRHDKAFAMLTGVTWGV